MYTTHCLVIFVLFHSFRLTLHMLLVWMAVNVALKPHDWILLTFTSLDWMSIILQNHNTLISSPDLSFITTWPFLWKVSTITLVSCLPLYIVKYLKRKFSPPSYSKLSSWAKIGFLVFAFPDFCLSGLFFGHFLFTDSQWCTGTTGTIKSKMGGKRTSFRFTPLGLGITWKRRSTEIFCQTKKRRRKIV